MSDIVEIPEPVAESVETTLTSEAFEVAFSKLETILKEFKTATSSLRQLKREIVSMEKSLKKFEDKKARRRKAATLDEHGNKRKNGFNRENNLISDELADFIGWDHGKPISRSEVTRRLTTYVKDNQLQDPENRRFVNLDGDAGQKLKSLLSDIVDESGNPVRLTIITINKYVNKHYVGKVVEEAPAVEQVAEVQAVEPVSEVPESVESSETDSVPKKKKLLKKKHAVQ